MAFPPICWPWHLTLQQMIPCSSGNKIERLPSDAGSLETSYLPKVAIISLSSIVPRINVLLPQEKIKLTGDSSFEMCRTAITNRHQTTHGG